MHAQAIWTAGAGDGDWTNGANWSSGSQPTLGQSVFFGTSSSTALGLSSGSATIGALTFGPDAPAYTLSISQGRFLTLSSASPGSSVVNISAAAQTIANLGGGAFTFGGLTTFSGVGAGNLQIINQGSTHANAYKGGTTLFEGGADAGTSTITNNVGVVSYAGLGETEFRDTSSAANSTIVHHGGRTTFYDTSTAAQAFITGESGLAVFRDNATAGSAEINGGLSVQFMDNSTAGAAKLEAGYIRFEGNSSGGTAQLTLTTTIDSGGVGRSTVADIASHQGGGITLGSIAGNGGYIDLGANNLTVGSLNTNTAFGGDLSGSAGGSLTKIGTGTLSLFGGGSYSGVTTISGGILQIGNGGTTGSLGNTSHVVNNAVLAFNRSNNVSFSPIISGTGGLTKLGGGTLTLTGVNTYSGGTTIEAGLVSFDTLAPFGTGNITLNGGGLLWKSGNTLDVSSRLDPLAAGGGTFHTGGNNVAFATALTGPGALTKAGEGTLTLDAANTYAGATHVTGGTLTFGANGTLGSPTAGLTVAGGTLNLATKNHSTGAVSLLGGTISNGTLAATAYDVQSGTLSATLSGPGALNKTTANTATLSGANSGYSGAVTVSAGTLRATGGASTLGTGALTLAGGTLELASDTGLAFNRNTSVTAASTLVSDRTSNGAAVTHSLGTLAIGATTLTTTRGTSATSGTAGLTFGATTLTGDATFAPGANTLLTLASVTGANTAFTTHGDGNLTVTGALGLGTGALVKSGAGTLTLSGTTSYGATTINGGTFALGTNAELGSGSVTINGGTFNYAKSAGLGTRNVALNGGTFGFTTAAGAGTGTLTFNGGTLQWTGTNTLDLSARLVFAGDAIINTGGNNVTFATARTSDHGLTKVGGGTLALASGTTFDGNVAVNAGILRATSDLATGAASFSLGGGTLRVTSSADYTTTAPVAVTAGSTFSFDRTSSGAATTHTFGPLALSAALTVAKTAAVASGTPTLSFAGTSTFTNGSNPSFNTLAGTLIKLDAVNGSDQSLKVDGTGDLTITGVAAGISTVAMNSTGNLLLANGANTYTGRTNINAGTVTVTKLANLGQASSLGAPTSASNGAIWLGFGTAGTLRYIGDTDSSTNRSVQLAGNTSIGSGLDASGAGTVSFTGTVGVLAPGAHTLTLSGTNTGANTLAGAIPNSPTSGNVSVLKSGTGTWVLAGASTYTGGTSINGGILRHGIAGALASTGAVTISSTTANTTATWDLNGYDQTVGGLTFGSTTGRLNTVNAVTTGTGTLTLGGNVTFTNSTGNANHAGTATLTGKLALGDTTRTFTIADSSKTGTELSIGAAISGTGGLTKAGNGVLGLTGINTYAGATTVTGGTLSVATLANAGVAGSLGASSNAAANLVLANGTLRYTGTGGQTDRLLQVGTASSNDGVISYLESSGTGAVAFTNTGAVTYGLVDKTRTLSLDGTNTGDNTFAATIGNNGTGAVRVDKEGAGKWILSGANTYTDITYIYGGTLSVAHDSGLGASSGGVTMFTGTTLDLNNVNIGAETLNIRGAGIGGNGALTFSGNSSHSGTFNYESPTVTIGGTGLLTLTGYQRTIYSSTVLTKLGSGTLAISGTSQVDNFGIDLREGTLLLAKDSSTGSAFNGTLLNIHSGATARLAGTGNNQIAYHSTVQVNSGGLFDLNGRSEMFAALAGTGGIVTNAASGTASTLTVGSVDWNPDSTFAGTLQDGAGTLALAKGGTGILTLSTANTHSGGTTISSGTLVVANDAAAGTGTLALNGGTLEASGARTLANAVRLNTHSTLGGAAALTFTNTLTATNNRTLTVANTAPTTFAAINLSNNDTGRTLTLDTTGGGTSVTGTIANGGAGAGNLIKSGAATLTLAGTNTYTGNTTVNAGSLLVTGSLGSGPYAGAIANSGTVTFASAADQTLSGVISGSGAFNHAGASTVTLGAANTYTGATTVSAGQLTVNGSIAASSLTTLQSGARLGGAGSVGNLTLTAGATLAPGNSPGTLTAGNTTWAGGARYEFEINAATGTAGTNWDLLAVSGTLAIDATSANPFAIDVLSLTSGNVAGALSGLAPGQTYTWELATATGGITGFAADKFTLNTAQFTSANSSVGGTFALQLGTRGFNNVAGSSLDLVYVAASAIPEPSTYAALAGLGALALAALRRRQRRGR